MRCDRRLSRSSQVAPESRGFGAVASKKLRAGRGPVSPLIGESAGQGSGAGAAAEVEIGFDNLKSASLRSTLFLGSVPQTHWRVASAGVVL
jgi:hypothetical protein